MVYVLAAVVGMFYAIGIHYLSRKVSLYLILIVSLLLVAFMTSGNWAELARINLANTIGFIVWLSAAPIALILIASHRFSERDTNIIAGAIGAISWASFSKISLFVGYLLGAA